MLHLFYDDYSNGVHPELLAAMASANDHQHRTYGHDDASELAASRIAKFFDAELDVHFVAGGSQANVVSLASMLRNYEGVIAPDSSHINVHETGALEGTGHKIITVAGSDGKLTPSMIDEAMSRHEDEHTVMPRVAVITQSTEIGTVYSREELFSVVRHAKQRGLYVYLDGARLAMGLDASDIEPADIVECGVDMFYVGGTKLGAAFGEAIAIANPALRQNFRYEMKHRTAMLAKGFFLGLQFARFFDDDDLWSNLGKTSNDKARRLGDAIRSNVEFAQEPQGNQLFVNLANDVVAQLQKSFGFHVWTRPCAEVTTIRLVCSWSTPDDMIDAFASTLDALTN